MEKKKRGKKVSEGSIELKRRSFYTNLLPLVPGLSSSRAFALFYSFGKDRENRHARRDGPSFRLGCRFLVHESHHFLQVYVQRQHRVFETLTV